MCVSPRCTGFISLFRDRETILHARLEPKQLSSFQTNMDLGVSWCRCMCVYVYVFDTWDVQKSWSLKRYFTERKKKTPHTHTCRKPGNDSLCPLTFDVWLLCEWWASWGLVDLRPLSVYLADGRGDRAWEKERGRRRINYFPTSWIIDWMSVFVDSAKKIRFSFGAAGGLLWFSAFWGGRSGWGEGQLRFISGERSLTDNEPISAYHRFIPSSYTVCWLITRYYRNAKDMFEVTYKWERWQA